ncbi:PheS-related mystery ligase SrmL [Pseudonocardia sp. TRM90224]|uniref:PheS-related mystery ligase SrmL n=1 Tax=Pseudonocardia sp. TRM90224 TaxID=2812678 RepID=UPI001E49D8FE|nr:hypothetical protein [Pseudonocardia sp. TRM90224]
MTTLLSPGELAAALELRDLSDPACGPHAMQILLDDAVAALAALWDCAVDLRRPRAVVSVEDNYDRLGYSPAAATRDGRYSRYISETVMLRSHTSAAIPPALRELARRADAAPDVLLVRPGLVHRRDVIDRLHVGSPHQLELWRIVRGGVGGGVGADDLRAMAGALVEALLPSTVWRMVPAEHPYTVHGSQIDVDRDGRWVELAECGLVAPGVLATAGLDPARWSGLALGMGLDRALMLRKHIPDIRLLRSADPRVAAQMRDLTPWQPVSMMPPVRRDLSIVTATPDEELLGDLARTALGGAADVLESLTVLTRTAHADLPPHVQERLGSRPGLTNVLLRMVLRPIDHTLTDTEANQLRDQVHAVLDAA